MIYVVHLKIVNLRHYSTGLPYILRLFVACDSEKFGNKCAHTCHCIDQPCDPKTGACSDSGCKRGYASFNCSIGMLSQ